MQRVAFAYTIGGLTVIGYATLTVRKTLRTGMQVGYNDREHWCGKCSHQWSKVRWG